MRQIRVLRYERAMDSETGVEHSMSTTSANVHDVTEAHPAARRGEAGVGRCGIEAG